MSKVLEIEKNRNRKRKPQHLKMTNSQSIKWEKIINKEISTSPSCDG